MKALFFGPSSSQLLGVYHAPNASADRFQGVVFCYPIGQEYMRAHRSFRQLANSLACRGYHVLRFDYRGTGDSAGDLEALAVEDWLQDIDYAVQELKDMTGINSVTLVGLRLGALLAGITASQRSDVSSLALWDPIVTGEEYLEQVRQRIVTAPPRKQASNFIAADGAFHFNGFHLPRRLQRSISSLDLMQLKPSPRRVLQVASHEKESFSALAEKWKNHQGFQYRYVPAEHDWNYVDHVGGILLPQPVIKEIANWI